MNSSEKYEKYQDYICANTLIFFCIARSFSLTVYLLKSTNSNHLYSFVHWVYCSLLRVNRQNMQKLVFRFMICSPNLLIVWLVRFLMWLKLQPIALKLVDTLTDVMFILLHCRITIIALQRGQQLNSVTLKVIMRNYVKCH